MDKDVIMTILKKANFSNEFIQYIEHHFPNDYRMMDPSPYVANYLENPLLHLDAKKHMIESIAQLSHLSKVYLEKHIPLSHLYKSIYDLIYRIERYFRQHRIYGLSERDIRWLTPIYRAEIFDIESLRFQIHISLMKKLNEVGMNICFFPKMETDHSKKYSYHYDTYFEKRQYYT